jgi:hypothetical protein
MRIKSDAYYAEEAGGLASFKKSRVVCLAQKGGMMVRKSILVLAEK